MRSGPSRHSNCQPRPIPHSSPHTSRAVHLLHSPYCPLHLNAPLPVSTSPKRVPLSRFSSNTTALTKCQPHQDSASSSLQKCVFLPPSWQQKSHNDNCSASVSLRAPKDRAQCPMTTAGVQERGKRGVGAPERTPGENGSALTSRVRTCASSCGNL